MSTKLPPLEPGTVLLETGRPDEENQESLLFRKPVEILSIHGTSDVRDLLEAVDDRLSKGFFAAGYLDYECGYAFEAFQEFQNPERPIAWFGVYHAPELERVLARDQSEKAPTADIEAVSFSWNRHDYGGAFDRTKRHLYEGDVYQINLTGKFRFDYAGSVEDLYRFLKQRQGVPFNALIVTEHEVVVSCSPELFFRREGARIWTRPMKGTIGRGRTIDEDRIKAHALADDPKSRAENLMIVDLLRNDLSRVARHGSVQVPELFTTERYETVIQLTSTVEAELRPDVGYAELFPALFPCGSVTGAPKIRAMEIIREVEEAARGVYTGAIGYAAPDGRAVFNVAIRTLRLADGKGEMGSGGGIVWDSNVDDEFEECLLKGRFLTAREPSFQLIETILYDDGLHELDRHMIRLLSSADFFGFAVDPRIVLQRIEQAVEEHAGNEPVRIRLLLSRDGSTCIETSDVAPLSEGSTIVVSEQRVNSLDRFLYHKTTNRELYRAELERARAAGHFDVVFVNERGELSEGARTNVYVQKNGQLLTPPVSSGLLAGTMRQKLLESGRAEERVLFPADLFTSDNVFVSNAILGLIEVRPVEQFAEGDGSTEHKT